MKEIDPIDIECYPRSLEADPKGMDAAFEQNP
jgi:hypothetical protein